MHHKTTQTVFDYFNRIRDGKPVPLRGDINPADLKAVLPDVFILEAMRQGEPVFRLAGTRVCAILGRELRGEDFKYLWHESNRHKMKLATEAVLVHQSPLTAEIRTVAEEEDNGNLEMLLMPLASRPGVCDRLLGSLVDVSKRPLLGERPRELWADNLGFAMQQEREPLRLVTDAGVAFTPVPSKTALQTRALQLKVFLGGRKD